MTNERFITILIYTLVGLFGITQYILNYFRQIIIDRYKEVIESYDDAFSSQDKKHEAIYKYCLKHIIQQSIEREDYEAAIETKKMLDNLENKNATE